MWRFQWYFSDKNEWFTRGLSVSLEEAIAISQRDCDCVRKPEQFRIFNLNTGEAISCALLN